MRETATRTATYDLFSHLPVAQPPETQRGSFWLEGSLNFADLFCGIGGFHFAARNLGLKCVFASDIDIECRKSYAANHGVDPAGDITQVHAKEIPAIDLLFAGFPCQPFSIIGNMHGFSDARGTLFFEIARILEAKKPSAFILENVRQLVSHNGGSTLARILGILTDLGYHTEYRVLNALKFGLPQKRERVLIVGFLGSQTDFSWPTEVSRMKPLSEILEEEPDPKHFVSQRIRQARLASHVSPHSPGIWHENKAGNISSYPYSCALRAGASYNYLLVNGERRLTPREMLRLQGFPDDFKIVCSDGQTRRQAGNAVPVPLVREVLVRVLKANRLR